MGFVLLGIYAWEYLRAARGSHDDARTWFEFLPHCLCWQAVCNFVFIPETCLRSMGFGHALPMLSAMALFFSVAAVGMPGLGNFIGEFLSLLGWVPNQSNGHGVCSVWSHTGGGVFTLAYSTSISWAVTGAKEPRARRVT